MDVRVCVCVGGGGVFNHRLIIARYLLNVLVNTKHPLISRAYIISLTYSLTHSLTDPPTYPPTHSLTHSLVLSPTC
jgi:hypothetical protein